MVAREEVGFVLSLKGYLMYLDGLPGAKINDLIQNGSGIRGLVSNLLESSVEVYLLDNGKIAPGDQFYQTGSTLSLPVGPHLLGRMINPLGVALDGKGMMSVSKTTPQAPLQATAPGLSAREFITEQFLTGITLVDNLIPIGRGQRELVLGDGHAGIFNFLTNLIVNQKNTPTVCVYAAIGKPANQIKNLVQILSVNQAISNTVIVATSSTDPAPLILLTPASAFAIAEHFQKQGQDVLIILDDLGIHATVYRELSLLSGKSPGRESYPGDIFHTHAALLERAGKFKTSAGGGSITALPVIELSSSNFTNLIPTNLMSITDGHLLFRSNLYNQNQRPAIDIAMSVSRVGRQTQKLISNLLSRKIRQIISAAEELETLSRFSTELPQQTQLLLKQKKMILSFLKQDDLTNIPLTAQTLLLASVFCSKPPSYEALMETKIDLEKITSMEELITHIEKFTTLT